MIKKGFTLTEVLITLGIIGVLAAITIPRLFNSTQNAHLGSQFSTAISTIETGMRMYLYDKNVKSASYLSVTDGDKTRGPKLSEILAALAGDYIKMKALLNAPACGYPCGASSGYALPDKSIIGVCKEDSEAGLTDHEGDTNNELYFLSSRSLNQTSIVEGYDYFRMSLSANGLIYLPGPDGDYDTGADYACKPDEGGKGCASKVAADGWKVTY